MHNNHPKELLPMTWETHERDANKKIHHHDEYQQPVMKFPFRIFKHHPAKISLKASPPHNLM